MLSERFMLFSPIELKFFFLCFSDLPNNEMTNNLYVCDSVTVSVVSSFLYLNIFQSAPNLVHLFLRIFKFYVFIDFSSFLGLSQFLRCNSDQFQIEVLRFLWSKWSILRLFLLNGVLCKKKHPEALH